MAERHFWAYRERGNSNSKHIQLAMKDAWPQISVNTLAKSMFKGNNEAVSSIYFFIIEICF